MSVLDRAALEQSPLADLHAIASELSIDGYRRLRRAELIDRIVARQEGGAEGAAPPADEEWPPEEARAVEAEASAPEEDRETAEGPEEGGEDGESPASSARRRGRRGGRGRSATREREPEERPAAAQEPESRAEEVVSGVVELLGNGSAFLRVAPPDPSDDDVYISSAQVKRCELVSGDRVEGPKRAPRRSERFASLVRVDTVNGRPAAELGEGVRFDDLPAAFATDRLALQSEDATLRAIDRLTPIGRGSRVAIVGEAGAGKSHAMRAIARALAGREGLSVQIVLAGVRPEEISDWGEDSGLPAPASALSFAASPDAQGAAVDAAIEQGRRLAARGADAVVLIDTLDGCPPPVARRALASARNIVGGGSLTVLATVEAPLGGETTVISLDRDLTIIGHFPALDIFHSATMRPELLVGEEGAAEIARTRVAASKIAED
ncbi:MAG: Rho termination factor N-terminal domain-containing protein [Solirubrobacteraceae bacterium]